MGIDSPLVAFVFTNCLQRVGNGRASKRQMQLAIQSVYGLEEPPEPPDVADALAIALCAANRL